MMEIGGTVTILGVLSLFAPFIYYVGFEAAFGRTPGKLLTGTRVVTLTGEPPSFGQCLGRAFARCVPFEPLSFLGGDGVGWHDKWTDTRVIRTR